MKTLHHKISALIMGLLYSTVIYIPVANAAGAGTLTDEPLFLTPGAKPNIFFMVDDSGSMDAGLITADSGRFNSNWAGTMTVENPAGRLWGYLYNFPDTDNTFFSPGSNVNVTTNFNRYVAPSLASVMALNDADSLNTLRGVWRAKNPDYNLAYYNPAQTYEPWTGVDTNGSQYQDASPTGALINPFNPNAGTYNLTTPKNFTTFRPFHTGNGITTMNSSVFPASYWTWNGDNDDSDGDGSPVDADENDELIIISGEELQNFANWWQYHRRREYALKGSMAEVIADSTGTRMGIATINTRVPAAEREIANMNDVFTSGNKKQLMDSLFSIDSGGGTPLNTALRDAGEYYNCSGTNLFGNSNCPIETNVVAPATEAAGVCQQNYTILLTDGAYTDNTGITVAGDADNNTAGNNTDFDGGPYADSESNTLADIAMHYYEGDLSGLPDGVSTQCGVDQNDAQHMVTYTISFGLDNSITAPPHPVLDIAGQNCDISTNTAPSSFADWPERTTSNNPPRFTNAAKIDELVHAAYNGRGQFFLANNADQLSASLALALSSIADRTSGTASAVSFNSTRLGTDSRLFLAQFNPERWSGDLLALDINTDGSIGSQAWSAADGLDGLENSPTPPLVPWSNRRIWTHNGSVAGSGGGIDFDFDALSNEQKNDLRTNPNGTITNEDGTGNNPLDDTAKERLAFIHGDQSNEIEIDNGVTTGMYRQRDSRLGDIIQSGAVFVGIPSLNWPDTAPFPTTDGERYSDFRLSESTVVRDPVGTGPVISVTSVRDEMVYVGANDGMLHGFNASNGAEQVAYIPSYLFSDTATRGLHFLTDPNYTHRYGHDLTPTISDVYLDDDWRSVLIGGHRAGASGFFALDVTDPATFNSSNPVMWEFRGEVGPDPDAPLGDADLGFTFSKPTIVLTNTVKNGQNRWAAVFGNGYNQSGDGDAQLFIVFLDPDLSNGWTLGSDYLKISTDSNGGSIAPNGLSTPALVDLNGDGTADRAYAGDLAGDMWAFDLCGTRDANGLCPTTNPATNWTVAHGSGTPLFDGDSMKPITTQPQIVRNPDVNTDDDNEPNLLVLFGSGRYISDGDNTNLDSQSFYGIWDAGSNGGNINPDTDLVTQTLLLAANTSENAVTDAPVSYSETTTEGFGWRFDLPVTGERSVSNAVVRNGVVFFSSIIPSVNPCDSGGTSFINFLAIENGGQPNQSVFDFTANGIVDNGDLLGINGSDTVGTRIASDVGIAASPSFLGDTLYIAGTETETGADIGSSGVAGLNPLGAGRISWGELLL